LLKPALPRDSLSLGGDYFYAANCGSRCGWWDFVPWTSYDNMAARFVAAHLVFG